MSAKQEILKTIRGNMLEAVELPELSKQPWIVYDDPRQHFCEMVAAVGGKAVIVPDAGAINQEINQIDAYASAKKTCSFLPGVGQSTFDMNSVQDPHELEDVDFCIAAGEFGVAENGAIWVPGGQVKHRVIHFITQHLSLVVPADQIVNNMHEAYERLSFDSPRFGIFISGPSKTADIEQSLVIGAHGPRSLTVFLTETP